MTLITPSGDTTGATDRANINAMKPSDELTFGDYYINGPLNVTDLRGVGERNHWGVGNGYNEQIRINAVALPAGHTRAGDWPDNAMLVNRTSGRYANFSLINNQVNGLNGMEIMGSIGLECHGVNLRIEAGKGLVGTSRWSGDLVYEFRFHGGGIYGCGDWGVDIDNITDSLFDHGADIAFNGRYVNNTGGVHFKNGLTVGFIGCSFQDIFGVAGQWTPGPAIAIDQGGAIRIVGNKFDQCSGGDISLNTFNCSISDNISLTNENFLRLGGDTFGIMCALNTTGGGAAYRCDPRTSFPLSGWFKDNVQGHRYYDPFTQTIMSGLVG